MTTYRSDLTYSASSPLPFSAGTPIQDVFSISGSSSNNISVLKMGISTEIITAAVKNIVIAKRSSPNIGGTRTLPTVVPYKSTNPSGTAVVTEYTAHPTTNGDFVGYIWSGLIYCPATDSDGTGYAGVEVDFTDMFGQPITLINENESIAWNFQGDVIAAGLIISCYVVWTEDPK